MSHDKSPDGIRRIGHTGIVVKNYKEIDKTVYDVTLTSNGFELTCQELRKHIKQQDHIHIMTSGQFHQK